MTLHRATLNEKHQKLNVDKRTDGPLTNEAQDVDQSLMPKKQQTNKTASKQPWLLKKEKI